MNKIILSLAALLLTTITAIYFANRDNETQPIQPQLLIGHAGGGYKGLTYTNSFQALEHNKNKYGLMEIDFSWTSDEHLVCIHSWHNTPFTSNKPPTLEEFQYWNNEKYNLKKCTLKSLIDWLENNPEVKIVTDIKDNNYSGLRLISTLYKDYKDRIIPQIYKPEEYKPVKDLGYENIIFTAYRYDGSHKDIYQSLSQFKLYAVTIHKDQVSPYWLKILKTMRLPYKWSKIHFIEKFRNRDTPVLLHTVNDSTEWEYFKNKGISGIYT